MLRLVIPPEAISCLVSLGLVIHCLGDVGRLTEARADLPRRDGKLPPPGVMGTGPRRSKRWQRSGARSSRVDSCRRSPAATPPMFGDSIGKAGRACKTPPNGCGGGSAEEDFEDGIRGFYRRAGCSGRRGSCPGCRSLFPAIVDSTPSTASGSSVSSGSNSINVCDAPIIEACFHQRAAVLSLSLPGRDCSVRAPDNGTEQMGRTRE